MMLAGDVHFGYYNGRGGKGEMDGDVNAGPGARM